MTVREREPYLTARLRNNEQVGYLGGAGPTPPPSAARRPSRSRPCRANTNGRTGAARAVGCVRKGPTGTPSHCSYSMLVIRHIAALRVAYRADFPYVGGKNLGVIARSSAVIGD